MSTPEVSALGVLLVWLDGIVAIVWKHRPSWTVAVGATVFGTLGLAFMLVDPRLNGMLGFVVAGFLAMLHLVVDSSVRGGLSRAERLSVLAWSPGICVIAGAKVAVATYVATVFLYLGLRLVSRSDGAVRWASSLLPVATGTVAFAARALLSWQ